MRIDSHKSTNKVFDDVMVTSLSSHLADHDSAI